MNKVSFTKMHGCGNDYIYVNAMQHPIKDPAAAARLWSDRHKGIGSDGLVLIDRSPIPEADFAMRIFNADGSEAMMCGNASRCIGKYLYERGITTQTRIRLLTLSGVKVLEIHLGARTSPSAPGSAAVSPAGDADEDVRAPRAGETNAFPGSGSVTSVTVDMGVPVFEDESQFLGNRGLDKGTFVSMGNPHYVIFTDNVDQVGVKGRALEYHPAFPQRCNIEFARIVTDLTPNPSPTREGNAAAPSAALPSLQGEGNAAAPSAALSSHQGVGNAAALSSHQGVGNAAAPSAALPSLQGEGLGVGSVIRTRVWERGSGITQACGTGACATAVAAAMTGRASRKSTIIMDGGTLTIEWRESDNHVYMTGPAEFVFDGEIEAGFALNDK